MPPRKPGLSEEQLAAYEPLFRKWNDFFVELRNEISRCYKEPKKLLRQAEKVVSNMQEVGRMLGYDLPAPGKPPEKAAGLTRFSLEQHHRFGSELCAEGRNSFMDMAMDVSRAYGKSKSLSKKLVACAFDTTDGIKSVLDDKVCAEYGAQIKNRGGDPTHVYYPPNPM